MPTENRLTAILWRLVAKLLARPAVAAWLIVRAQHTPYLNIMSAYGSEMNMGRWWLFTPYFGDTHKLALWLKQGASLFGYYYPHYFGRRPY